MKNFLVKVAMGIFFLGGGVAVAIGLEFVFFHLFIAEHHILTRVVVAILALYMFLVGYKSVKEVRESGETKDAA